MSAASNNPAKTRYRILDFKLTIPLNEAPNSWRYPLVGGTRLGWEPDKTQSQKNACKTRRIPLVSCTFCWVARSRFRGSFYAASSNAR
jgi:hypothetical protein